MPQKVTAPSVHVRGDRRRGERLIHQKFVNRFHRRLQYLAEMPEPKVYEFSKHIALCARPGARTSSGLGAKLGIDPMELLQMINGKAGADRTVISGWERNPQQCVPPPQSWPLKSNRDTGQHWAVVSQP